MKDGKARRYAAVVITIAVSILFYLIWYFCDGVIITPDSESYITMASDREPGYCLYLWLFRTLFGSSVYLDVAVIGQCIIAGISTAVFVLALKGRFGLNWLASFGIWGIQCGLTLLNRFVAARGYSYFNSIRCEALAYSFYLFLVLGLIGIIYDKKRKNVIISLFWAIVLISIRKQMLVSLWLIFVCCVYAWWKKSGKKANLKAITCAAIVAIVGFFGARLVDCTYNYAFRGEFTAHTGDSTFILGNEIYAADVSMVEYISDETNREIFLEIMSRCDDEGYNIKYAPGGGYWHDLEDHYSSSYDRIKFDVIMVVVREYQDSIGMEEALRDDSYNEIAGTLMRELLLPCLPNLLKVSSACVVGGFITVVLKIHPVLNIVAVLLYVGYIALFVVLVKKGSYKNAENTALPFAAFVMLSLVSLILLTSATIYCQMRYMLYNTGLFYQAALLMLFELWKNRNGDKNG